MKFNPEGAENAEVRRVDLNTLLCGSQPPLRLCVKKIRALSAQIELLQYRANRLQELSHVPGFE